MIRIIEDLPDNVVGLMVVGEFTQTEHKTVLIPRVEHKLKAHEKLTLLYQLDSTFKGHEVHSVVNDGTLLLKHLIAWEKIALVSDYEYIKVIAGFFGKILSCDVKAFKNAELEKAKIWAGENQVNYVADSQND